MGKWRPKEIRNETILYILLLGKPGVLILIHCCLLSISVIIYEGKELKVTAELLYLIFKNIPVKAWDSDR